MKKISTIGFALLSLVGIVTLVKRFKKVPREIPEGYKLVKIKKPYKYFAQRCEENSRVNKRRTNDTSNFYLR